MSQPDLFSLSDAPVDAGAPPAALAALPHHLTPRSPLSAAFAPYQAYMHSQGMSDNTVKAFMSDVRLLSRYFKELAKSPRLEEIGGQDLNQFLYWLKFERANSQGRRIPCSPKSYARRITTLKSFFGWLEEENVLPASPAAAVIQESVRAPLPRILYDAEIDRLVRSTRDLLWSPTKPDARPHLLVLLLLQTGLKKAETAHIRLGDIDFSNPREPELLVRHDEPRNAHKERKLFLGAAFQPVYNQYIQAYKPQEFLFECTPRNLEYVLAEAAALAEIKDGVSFETMRWTAAVRSYRFGTPPDALRKKLGLSPITWRETFEKIKKLAGPGL